MENKLLIKKNGKSDLLDQRENIPTPKNVFTSPSNKEKKKVNRINQTTTARISFETLYRANALVTMGLAESFDDLINDMLDNFENKLSREEMTMQKAIIQMYRNKK